MYKKNIKTISNLLIGFIIILTSLFLFLSLISYNELDPSFNTIKNSETIINSMGIYGSYTADLFIQMFGIISFFIAGIIAKIGFNKLKSKLKRYNKFTKITMFMLFIMSTCALTSILFNNKGCLLYNNCGGFVGYTISNLTSNISNKILIPFYIISIFISFVILIDCSYRKIQTLSTKLYRKTIILLKLILKIIFKLIKLLTPKRIYNKIKSTNTNIKERRKQKTKYKELVKKEKHLKIKQYTKTTNQKYKLPLIDILTSSENKITVLTKEELKQQANDLLKVLKDFKLNGKIINVKAGPVITLHEFEPSAGTKSSRIITLADDIARNLKVKSARISVISERNVVGIELPNKVRNTIFLKDILMSNEYRNSSYNIPIILGSNIAGESVLMDLAKAPHLLIAGTTGSGKSVCINTMVLSLLYRFTPDECKMIMIDPKMLELSAYEGIPHLLMPVVTDPKKAVLSLKWVVDEMQNRYKLMSSLGVRNIYGYNEKIKEAKNNILTTKNLVSYDENGDPVYENKEIECKKMPFIVVIVDEMADLMITAGKEIEALIQRIAQMARASGIHIIMATQRPSVDVVTGVIKANFPSRISFLVSSKIDSKVIIGEQGAEQLLGMGDMLFMPNGGKISRAHGPFVSDKEVEDVVNYIIKQGIKPEYVNTMLNTDDEDNSGNFNININSKNNSEDELYRQAVDIIMRDGKVSISYIQRQLRIGYNKSANLVERMEREGIVSPPNSTGKREILKKA